MGRRKQPKKDLSWDTPKTFNAVSNAKTKKVAGKYRRSQLKKLMRMLSIESRTGLLDATAI